MQNESFFLILTLFIVASITFFLMKMLPGTPYNNPKVTGAQLAALNKANGLDKPVWYQYIKYLVGLLHGDMGTSYQFAGQSVSHLIISRVGPSFQIGAQAMIVGTAGDPAGGHRGYPQELLGRLHGDDFRHPGSVHP